MDTNGAQNTVLSDFKADFLFVSNDTIYSLGSKSDRYAGLLYTMSIDGSGFKSLLNDKINQIYFYDNYIYYSTFSNEQTLIYKMDMAGENENLIFQSANSIDRFYIYNGDIFFVATNGGITIHKYEIAMKEDTIIYEVNRNAIPNGFINIMNDNLYFIATAPRTYICLNLNTGEATTSSNYDANDVGLYTIGNKVFYYQNKDGNDSLYMMNIDGNDKEPFN